MFGHQLYPTPEHVIKRMLKYRPVHEDQRIWEYSVPKRILEPSAGTGAMLDYIKDHLNSSAEVEMHCCEIDTELNAMLQGKGHTVVGTDFLDFKTDDAYNFIIMNPPFDTAAAHITHAWEMLNGELVALCNAETVRNPRGEHGVRLQQLIAQDGSVEYIGRPFADADALRKTDVEVALIRLSRSMDDDVPEWWAHGDFNMESTPDLDLVDQEGGGVIRYDRIDALIGSYASARGEFRKYLIARERLYTAIGPLTEGSHQDPVEEAVDVLDRAGDEEKGIGKADRHFGASMQRMAWKAVFNQGKFGDYATAGVMRNLNNLLKQQQAMAFDRPNIVAMLELLFFNRHEILKQAMLETFDRLCSYFTGNTSHWEGWKSNEAHMVNRKVVVPHCGLSYDRQFGGSFTSYNLNLTDIDRTMAMLEGRKLSDKTQVEHLRWVKPVHGEPYERSVITIADAIKHSIAALPTPIENHYFYDLDNTAESEYFLIRYWKKGTVHLYFKDEALWQRFNREAAQGKKWMPFDPDHVPVPKTKPSERKAVKELQAIAAVRAQNVLNESNPKQTEPCR